jgi:hypothetical protein
MQPVKLRRPVVAGQFYPSSKLGVERQIASFVDEKTPKTDALGCMLPHAGYMYSGMVASQTVSRINIKDKIILLGPNHTGNGAPFSIMTDGIWQTPLGDIKIDSGLAKKMLQDSKYLEEDALAHAYEHSLEVELPILQYFKPQFDIVPIAFLSDDLGALKEAGREIGTTISSCGNRDSIMFVASSDMTHYESEAEAKRKDHEAIKAILALNEDELMEKIRRFKISMCGYAPVIAMLSAVKVLGAKTGELIKYQTSGDVTGDRDSVVGYAGIIIA